MDFHLPSIFVNLSLTVLSGAIVVPELFRERAIVAEGEPIEGKLTRNAEGKMAFRVGADQSFLPLHRIRRVEFENTPAVAAGTSPAHRIVFWGLESLSGTLRGMDEHSATVVISGGAELKIPLFAIASIEHFHGDAVLVHDDFEADDGLRQLTGDARIIVDQAASGKHSVRLAKPGDSLEYRLREPVGGGWFECRFYDSAATHPVDWICELVFSSAAGDRPLQILLGWEDDSYGLLTPQGPSLPVQHLARQTGWHRIGVRFAPDRIAVLINDAVLTHSNSTMGPLKSIRIRMQSSRDQETPPSVAGFVDDLQVAATLGSSMERQPTSNQDDLLLTSGDQLFGRLESATDRAMTIRGEFGAYAVPWSEVQQIHLSPRPCPPTWRSGQRALVRFTPSAAPRLQHGDPDLLEGAITELDDDAVILEHAHAGTLRIPRTQVREIEFLPSTRWLVIDSRYHHFGDQVQVRFQLPHPQGSDQSWTFSIDEIPERPILAMYVVGMEAQRPGGEFAKRLENDEWRTYVAINGQKLDPLGLNHLLPLNTRTPVRVQIPIVPGVLKPGENTLRIFQTAQRDNPESFDDCGIFGISLDLADEAP